jgi:hypothetical protein
MLHLFFLKKTLKKTWSFNFGECIFAPQSEAIAIVRMQK